MYFFYILRCSDNSLYCGQTNDLEKRISEHNSDKALAAKYTRSRQPVTLVYFEKFKTLHLAAKREYEVKQWPKAKKEALVQESLKI